MAIMGFSVFAVLFLCMTLSKYIAIVSIAVGLVILAVTLMFKNARKFVFLLFLSGALIFGGLFYISADKYGYENSQKFVGKDMQIEAVVSDYPEHNNSRYYYIIKSNKINAEKAEYNIKLSLPFEIDAQPFDTIKLDATIYSIGESDKNIKTYYKSKEIYLGAYTYNTEDYKIEVKKCENNPIGLKLINLQNTIKLRILDKLPNEYGGLAVGMLIGDKNYISTETSDCIYEAGIAPLFAVSGLHLSIWVLGLYKLLEQLRVKRKINSIIGIAFTVAFMGITGFSNSVCRSGIMMILLLVGNLFYRKSDSVNSLGLAALLLCAINPFIVNDVGFLMSFTSTLGIVTIYPALTTRLFKRMPVNVFTSIVKSCATPIIVSMCAVVASFPINVFFFGYVSVMSVISNFVITNIAVLCMVFAGFSVIFYRLDCISNCFAILCGILSRFVLKIIHYIGSLEFTTISTADIYWKIGTILCIAGVLFSILVFKEKAFIKSMCLGIAIAIISCSVFSYIHYDGLTEIKILGIENGISAVAFNGNKKIVIGSDAGYYTHGVVKENLDKINRNNADLLIVPQGLSESENTIELLKEYDFNKVILSENSNAVETIEGAENIVTSQNISVDVWKNSNIKFVNSDKYSLSYCNFENVSILFLFSSDSNADIPEKYSQADYLVCCGYIPYSLAPTNFGTVIISANSKSAEPIYKYVTQKGVDAITTAKNGNIIIDIKDENIKIMSEED